MLYGRVAHHVPVATLSAPEVIVDTTPDTPLSTVVATPAHKSVSRPARPWEGGVRKDDIPVATLSAPDVMVETTPSAPDVTVEKTPTAPLSTVDATPGRVVSSRTRHAAAVHTCSYTHDARSDISKDGRDIAHYLRRSKRAGQDGEEEGWFVHVS